MASHVSFGHRMGFLGRSPILTLTCRKCRSVFLEVIYAREGRKARLESKAPAWLPRASQLSLGNTQAGRDPDGHS